MHGLRGNVRESKPEDEIATILRVNGRERDRGRCCVCVSLECSDEIHQTLIVCIGTNADGREKK